MRSRMEVALLPCLIYGCAVVQPTMTRSVGSPMPGTARAVPLMITSVGVEPKTIDITQGREATIRYTVSRACTVTVDFADEEGRLIRRVEAGRQPAGTRRVVWDGRTAWGTSAPTGVYRYIIRAVDESGGERVHDPSDATGGEELQPRDFTFDKTIGTLQWTMPRAGYVRLRIGIEGFPHLRTLLDWEPLEGGQQVLSWDGRDHSGLIRFADHPNLSIKLTAFAMPDNTILVRGTSVPVPISQPQAYPPMTKSEPGYFHARHLRGICREVAVRVEFPDAARHDPDGRPVLTGRVPVRVILDAQDAAHLVSQRFEVAIFEGLTILFEVEDGSNPFTFLWDTSHLPDGPHLMVVNILSYDDHYGVAVAPVVVDHGGTSS